MSEAVDTGISVPVVTRASAPATAGQGAAAGGSEPNAWRVIRRQAERFNAGLGGTLIVSGHANPVDEPEAAVQLSMHRTQAVAALLEQFGVQSHRIVRVSHGSNAPVVDLSDESSRWANRCVEIRHGGLSPRQPVWSQRLRKPAKR